MCRKARAAVALTTCLQHRGDSGEIAPSFSERFEGR
jgi:hypothetical protein